MNLLKDLEQNKHAVNIERNSAFLMGLSVLFAAAAAFILSAHATSINASNAAAKPPLRPVL